MSLFCTKLSHNAANCNRLNHSGSDRLLGQEVFQCLNVKTKKCPSTPGRWDSNNYSVPQVMFLWVFEMSLHYNKWYCTSQAYVRSALQPSHQLPLQIMCHQTYLLLKIIFVNALNIPLQRSLLAKFVKYSSAVLNISWVKVLWRPPHPSLEP